MSKNAVCLTSIVAALPGAWVAVLVVMGFLSEGAGGWSAVIKALSGLLLLIGGSLAVMPVGILLFMGPKKEKPAKAKEKAAKDKSDEGEVAAVIADEEVIEADDATFEVDQDHRDSEEFVETIGQPTLEAESDDFDLGADFELDSSEDVEPKGKKRK